MTPERFKNFQVRIAKDIVPLKEQLKSAEKEVDALKRSLKCRQQFKEWCEYLTNGETMGGFLGGTPTYAMFVRQYSVKPCRKGDSVKLVSVDLIIISEVLAEHKLRVDTLSSKTPGVLTNSAEMVAVPEIVRRMQAHTKNAKNVSLGTFADVMREPCAKCGEQAMVVALEKYIDEDNGRDFSVDRLCDVCSLVDNIASYDGETRGGDPQYRYVDGIYR